MNLASHRCLAPVLTRLDKQTKDDQPLWQSTQEELSRSVAQSASELCMGHMKVVQYSFRHGGASRGIISGERDLVTVKKVLRHTTDLSARRYEKAGRLAIEVHKMPVETQAYGSRVATLLARIFQAPECCPAPPRIPGRC